MFCPHCNTHINLHPASSCLDAWIAETAMGWMVEVDKDLDVYWYKNRSLFSADVDQYPHNTSSWCPSRHVATAFEVLEKLSAEGYSYQVLKHSNPGRGDCLCELWKDFYRWIVNHQETVPLAVCRAVIKTMM